MNLLERAKQMLKQIDYKNISLGNWAFLSLFFGH